MPLAPYERIARSLRDQIVGGVYEPGTLLPSVREIQGEEGTSKATVEKALRVLKDERLVETRPGAGLAVVAPAKIDTPRDMFLRTTALAGDIRLANEKSEYRHVGLNNAPAPVAELLDVPKNSKVVNRARVIKRSGRPVMLATSWFPLEYREIAPKLVKRDRIPQGTPKYVAECLGTNLAQGHDRITIDQLDPQAAFELGQSDGDRVLYIENKVMSSDGRLIEVGVYHMIPGLDVEYDYELMHEE